MSSKNKLTRDEVFGLIDGERAFQDTTVAAWLGGVGAKPPVFSLGEHATMLRHYIRLADEAYVTKVGDQHALGVLRKIAGISVRAMEQVGVVYRDGKYFAGRNHGISREHVYQAISGEREYQDQRWEDLDDRNTVGDFLTYLNRYATLLTDSLNPDEPQAALDNFRKIAGIAVACMERHGAPARSTGRLGEAK